jgi:Family of unknown function (DUF6510)
MDALDGNAIGGMLHEIFGTEMTTAVGTCATCGARAMLAETLVYLSAPGAIVRCRICTSVLMVAVRREAMNCIDMFGIAELEPA